jgi:DNA-binding MarR family transcriptional regulator
VASETTSPAVPEHQIGEPRVSYAIGRLDRAVRQRLDDAVRAHGVTIPQYTALSVLRARGGLSNAQLARRSLMTPQSMSEVLAALTEKRLITRTAAPDHGRIKRAELTDAGREVLDACDVDVDEIEQEMLGELDFDERDRFMQTLKSCLRRLGAGLDAR